MKGDRFWYGSNIGANLVQMFERLFDWTRARESMHVFQFYIQHILNIGPIGANTTDELIRVDAFRLLREWGIQCAIEAGAIKDGDPHAENNINGLRAAAQIIADNGGVLNFVTMDEPLTAVKDYMPTQPLEESAETIAAYILAGEQLGAKVGWAEAWPHVELETQRRLLSRLDALGRLPHYWHWDIDSRSAIKEKKSIEAFVRDAQTIADDYGMPTGIYLAGYPAATDVEYMTQTLAWAGDVFGMLPKAKHVLCTSWATRGERGPQDIPANIPETALGSMTALFNAVVEMYS